MSAAAEKAWSDVMATHSGLKVGWGPNSVDCLINDPRRIVFLLSRYKFAAKMMTHCSSIIDVGCGDGMGTLMFLSNTGAGKIVGIDIEASLIEHANNEFIPALPAHNSSRLSFVRGDFSEYPKVVNAFDGLCCLDMIEHVDPDEADWFMAQFALVMKPHGVAVIGTPNRLAAEYGSVHSKAGHINLYEPDMLRVALEHHFGRLFLFSMNDEVVHTGFDRLAHYLIALCVK